jgi:hypothetical protein
MTSSDPRFSLAAWQRYEDTVAAWLQVYPSAHIFAPSNLSLETAIARLRDAVKAKLQYMYPSHVNHNALASAWPNVVVTRDRNIPGLVRIGPPQGKVLTLTTALPPVQRDGITVIDPNVDVLDALCLLVNAGVLSSEIHCKAVSPYAKEWFQTSALLKYPNIAYMDTDTDAFTII